MMFARYLSSATLGLAVTTALLWSMQYLITIAESAGTAAPTRHPLPWVRIKRDETITPAETRPEPIPDPPTVPETRPPSDPTESWTPIPVARATPAPGRPEQRIELNGPVDGDVVSILHAEPHYPQGAVTRGLEGFVVVEFDVTESGTVENARVVESSDRVFEREALKAAYRARYKPRTVDGVPQPARGLKKRFRFAMDEQSRASLR